MSASKRIGQEHKLNNITMWGLDKKNERIVRRQLNNWLQHLMKLSNQETGNVYRCDFVNWDFFYFTKCHDLMGDKPEHKAVEQNKEIGLRKDVVFIQLFIKTLLGDVKLNHVFCTHCGVEQRVDVISNGHMYFCPGCGKTDVSVYPETCAFSFNEVQKKIWSWEQEKNGGVDNNG